MIGMRSEQVINGTHGELWFDGDYVGEVTAFKAEITFKKSAVAQAKNMVEGQKITGLELKGEFKIHKVNSYIMKKLSDAVKAGRTPKHTIVSNIVDPDAAGGERIACYACVLDKMILADWENGKLGEESYGFTYGDWDIINSI